MKAYFIKFIHLILWGTFENDGVPEHRILKVNDWIPHIEKLGANAIYFSIGIRI